MHAHAGSCGDGECLSGTDQQFVATGHLQRISLQLYSHQFNCRLWYGLGACGSGGYQQWTGCRHGQSERDADQHDCASCYGDLCLFLKHQRVCESDDFCGECDCESFPGTDQWFGSPIDLQWDTV